MTGNGLTKFVKIMGILCLILTLIVSFTVITALISVANTTLNIIGIALAILLIGIIIYYLIK